MCRMGDTNSDIRASYVYPQLVTGYIKPEMKVTPQ